MQTVSNCLVTDTGYPPAEDAHHAEDADEAHDIAARHISFEDGGERHNYHDGVEHIPPVVGRV